MSLLDVTAKNTNPVEPLLELIPKSHMDAWSSASLNAQDLLMSLPDACIDEFDQALSRTGDVEIPDTSDRGYFPNSYNFAHELLDRLDSKSLGAAIVDRLPAERYNDQNNRRVCGMFSSLVGKLMEQNHAGVTLYDVKNTNPKNPAKVRKSITNFAQPYHTDGGWHRVPAKYVGLYCVRNAKDGGGSKLTSMLNAFNAMHENPEEMQLLLEMHPWDMQGEHEKGKPGITMNPMYELYEGQFLSRYYESYIRNGYKLAKEELPVELDLALTKLRDIINEQHCVRFEMTSGQFQYLNNWTILHGRESFNDNEETPRDETRHVIRVWNH